MIAFLTVERRRKITNIIFAHSSNNQNYWHFGLKKIPVLELIEQYRSEAESWDCQIYAEMQLDVLNLRLFENHFLLIIMEPVFHQEAVDFYKEFSFFKECLYLHNSSFKEELLQDILNTLKRIFRNFIFDTYLLNLVLKDQFFLVDTQNNFYLNTTIKHEEDVDTKKIKNFFTAIKYEGDLDIKKIKNFFNIPPSHTENFTKEVTTPYDEKFKIEFFKLMDIVDQNEVYSVMGYRTIPLVFHAHSIFENYRFLNQTSVPMAIFDVNTRVQFKNTAWIQFFDDYDTFDFIKNLNTQCFLENKNIYDESTVQGRFIKWYFDPIVVSKEQYTLVTAIDSTHTQKEEIETTKTMERLKQSNEDLRRFAHICSHDLKEPLRTISSFSQVMRTRLDPKDDESQQYLDLIIKNTFYMKNLIEDLLRYSEYEFHPQNLNEEPVGDILQDVLNILSSKIKERRALIRMQDTFPETIFCNKTQITQVFQNIIDNGIKFNNKKIPIVDIGYINDEHVDRFFVKDNGIGVSEEYIHQLFSMFKRLHNKNEFQGSGIGLAMCKKIIENHKGQVWIESNTNQGTIVYFDLPKNVTKGINNRRQKCAV